MINNTGWTLTEKELGDLTPPPFARTTNLNKLYDDDNREHSQCDLLSIAQSGDMRQFEATLKDYRHILIKASMAKKVHEGKTYIDVRSKTAKQVMVKSLEAMYQDNSNKPRQLIISLANEDYESDTADFATRALQLKGSKGLKELLAKAKIDCVIKDKVTINSATTLSSVLTQLKKLTGYKSSRLIKQTQVGLIKKSERTKDKVQTLKKEGLKQVNVAETLNVCLSTVKRNWH